MREQPHHGLLRVVARHAMIAARAPSLAEPAAAGPVALVDEAAPPPATPPKTKARRKRT